MQTNQPHLANALRILAMDAVEYAASGHPGAPLGEEECRLAVEAGVSDYWRKYVGLDGHVVGIDSFEESAPAADLFEHFSLSTRHLVEKMTGVFDSNGHYEQAV